MSKPIEREVEEGDVESCIATFCKFYEVDDKQVRHALTTIESPHEGTQFSNTIEDNSKDNVEVMISQFIEINNAKSENMDRDIQLLREGQEELIKELNVMAAQTMQISNKIITSREQSITINFQSIEACQGLSNHVDKAKEVEGAKEKVEEKSHVKRMELAAENGTSTTTPARAACVAAPEPYTGAARATARQDRARATPRGRTRTTTARGRSARAHLRILRAASMRGRGTATVACFLGRKIFSEHHSRNTRPPTRSRCSDAQSHCLVNLQIFSKSYKIKG